MLFGSLRGVYHRRMKPVSVTVRQSVQGTPERAFGVVIPVDLPEIFRGYGPLPAVVGTRHQVGDWDAAGDTRVVLLKGGGVMVEELTRVERPGRCEYRVRPTKGPLRLVVEHIDGRFLFEPATDGGAVIDWTYSFVAKRGRRALLVPLAPLWRRYATQILQRAAVLIEAQPIDR